MKSLGFLSLLVLAVAGALSTTECRAESTEQMLSACRQIADAKISGDTIEMDHTFDIGLCWGAFSVIQRLSATVDHEMKPILSSCAPSESTRTQLIAIYVRYAEKHPEKYHQDFVYTALSAMREAFPCPAKK